MSGSRMRSIPRYPRRVPLLLAMLGLVAAGAGACGIQAEDRMTPLAADELDSELRNTTTTTTTTTTVPPTTDPPDATASTIEPEPTTSTTEAPPLVPTQPTDVFYVYFGSNSIQRLPLNLPFDPVVVQHLIDALESPPANATLSAYNLTTALVPGLVDGEVQVEGGLATVALDEEVLSGMSPTQQPRAIAQIVLTLTWFRTPDRGPIAQVQFTINGEPVAVFVPALGGNSAEPVAFSDFASLLVETAAEPTTTPPPTTVAPEATGPEPDPPPDVTEPEATG